MKINVVDAPCGYGKSSWAIQYMNEMSEVTHRFIYVTPFLSEVERVKNSVTKRKMYEPKAENGYTKLDDIHELIKEGKDICTTHALFKTATNKTKELLNEYNYTLILDEVMNVIEQINLMKHDLKILEDSGTIYFEDDVNGLKYIRWNEDKKEYDTKYNQIKSWALSGNLMFCNDTAVIWQFPCDIFKAFQNVYILTFLFHGQIQKAYYDINRVSYNYFSVKKINDKYKLIKYVERVKLDKEQLKKLINIYEGDLNSVGAEPYSLSRSWFNKSKSKEQKSKLKNNTRNYFMNKLKVLSNETMWTVFKGNNESLVNDISPKGFKKGFIPVNERATNKYSERFALAYLVNRYLNPIEEAFFEQYSVKVDENRWALAELIQWIWRSRIRNQQSINIYIPSYRMRDLLKTFLIDEVYEELPSEVCTNGEVSDWHL